MASVSVTGKGSLPFDTIMAEITNIKETQKRYAEQFLLSKTNSAAAGDSFSDVAQQSQQLQSMDDSIKKLELMVEEMAIAVKESNKKIDDLEQYGRRNCLILHGVQDFPNSTTYGEFELYVLHKLNSRLNLEYKISSEDIDTCHVLPSRTSKSKPIIIKFVRRSIKELVYANKRRLKANNDNEKLGLTESLTRRRLNILFESKKAFGFSNVWTQNGNIFCFYNEKRQVIDDFNKIANILDK